MEYDLDRAPDFMPPNDPWKPHNPSDSAQSYLSIYFSEDKITKYPVREVTKVTDNKSDPNLETMSYGVCSTCTRPIRSGLVKNNRPYIFFCTSFKGQRVLTGYYHIGWYDTGPPLFSNLQSGQIQDDYRLVADEMKFIYPAISLGEIVERCDLDYRTGFRKKLIGPEETNKLLELLDEREDRTEKYIEEIRRLERVNNRYHQYRHPTWERKQKFTMENLENYVVTTTDWNYDDLKDEIESISTENVSEWHCLSCTHQFSNKAPLRLCPKCDKHGTLIPAKVWQSLK